MTGAVRDLNREPLASGELRQRQHVDLGSGSFNKGPQGNGRLGVEVGDLLQGLLDLEESIASLIQLVSFIIFIGARAHV